MVTQRSVFPAVILLLLGVILLLGWRDAAEDLNFQKAIDSTKNSRRIKFYERNTKPPVSERSQYVKNQNFQEALDSIKNTQQQRVVFYERKARPPILEPLGSRELGPPGKASAADELERIWNYVYYRQYHCEESEYLGGKANGDGAYDLCVEKQFWPFPDASGTKCLVYSIGVGADFTFDDAMAKVGCEVHAFDPSVKLDDGMIRESGVIFHKVGIADEDNDHGFKGWKMRTLKTIIKELGHQNRYLDYLKVDTDKHDGTGFEDTVMQELLDTGLHKCVRQYAMEIHMPGPLAHDKYLQRCRRLYKQMRELNDVAGWRLYNTTDNVRYLRTIQSNANQRKLKLEQLNGKGSVILWENAFVNFDVEGPCEPYVK